MGTRQPGRGQRAAVGDGVVRVQSEIRDNIEQERLKRFAREYKQSVDMEDALASLSRFSFQPVDYGPALVRREWVAPPVPDFSYILVETRLKVTNKYLASISTQLLAGLFFVILSLAFMNTFVPIIGVVGLAICALALNRELQNRRREIDRALTAARAEIDRKVQEAKDSIEKARDAFVAAEEERVGRVERLLNADPGAVFERLEEVLSSFKMPFYLRCSIDFYETEPLITLHLPGHNVIPDTIVTMSDTGMIDYTEKSAPEINRQFTEALAGAALTLALLAYSYVPPLDAVYVRAISDRFEDPECHFSLRLTRDAALEAAAAPDALTAFEQLGARYEVGQNGNFTPAVQPLLPGWLRTAPHEKVRSTKFTILSKFG